MKFVFKYNFIKIFKNKLFHKNYIYFNLKRKLILLKIKKFLLQISCLFYFFTNHQIF